MLSLEAELKPLMIEFDTILARNHEVSPMDLDDFCPSVQEFMLFMIDVKAVSELEKKHAKKPS